VGQARTPGPDARAGDRPAHFCWEDRRVVPENLHDFFLSGASVAGALIGLLFVAISVSAERLARQATGTQLNRIRASAALSAFTNALAISLFALVPGDQTLGITAVSVSVAGLLFVAASLLSLVRLHEVRWSTVRDGLFLIGLFAVFLVQLIEGADLLDHPADSGSVDTIAIMVIVCFLIGVARAWELIGGPSIGIREEVTALVRNHDKAAEGPGEEESETRSTA
jgi:hypothetical protein